MDTLAYKALPAVPFLIIGVYSSYTDFRYRRIRNRIIFYGVISAVVLELIAIPSPAGHGNFILNTALSLLGAVFLWRANIWAAGDAKFFIFSGAALSSLFSSGSLTGVTGSIPAAAILLCNSFVLAFAYIAVEAAIFFIKEFILLMRGKELRRQAQTMAGKVLRPGFLMPHMKVFLLCGVALSIFPLLNNYVAVHAAFLSRYPLVLFVVMMVLYMPVSRVLRKVPGILLAAVSIVLILTHKLDIISVAASTLKFYLALGLVRAGISYFLNRHETTAISVDSLEPYMMVAAQDLAAVPAEHTKESRFLSDGLTREQAEYLKTHFKETGKSDVRIYRTFPFVPFITAAMAAAYLLHGRPINLLGFLY